jgi:hypothetical protein
MFSTVAFVCNQSPNKVKNLLDFITEYNSNTLGYKGDDKEVFLAAKFFDDPQTDQHLDLLTGYHIFDEESNLIFVEGIASQGLQEITEFAKGYLTNSAIICPKKETYNRQREMKSPNIMHIMIQPSINKICSWTKKTYLDAQLYEGLNLLKRVGI